MYMKGQRSWIFRSCDKARQSENGEGESSENSRLASIKKCERCTEVFGVSKLLQMVCQGFCQGSKTSL